MFFDTPKDEPLTTKELMSFIKMVYDSVQTEEDFEYAESFINMVLMEVGRDQIDEIIDTISMAEEMARMRLFTDKVIH